MFAKYMPVTKKSHASYPYYLEAGPYKFQVVHIFIKVYNSNLMHRSQTLFNLITALHVSAVTITHLQEHTTTVITASGNHYTVIDRVKFTDKEHRHTRLKLQ
jgi:hypothetical protein